MYSRTSTFQSIIHKRNWQQHEQRHISIPETYILLHFSCNILKASFTFIYKATYNVLYIYLYKKREVKEKFHIIFEEKIKFPLLLLILMYIRLLFLNYYISCIYLWKIFHKSRMSKAYIFMQNAGEARRELEHKYFFTAKILHELHRNASITTGILLSFLFLTWKYTYIYKFCNYIKLFKFRPFRTLLLSCSTIFLLDFHAV